MNTDSLRSLFQERISAATLQAAAFQNTFNLYSILRLIVAIGIAVCIGLCLSRIQFMLFSFTGLALSILFIILLLQHKKVKDNITFQELLIQINANEEKVLDGHFKQNYSGEIFQDAKHHYASDLDIFGNASLYQYVCRAWTKGGRTLLASWFLAPVTNLEILRRQGALAELMPLLDWRQKLEAQARGLSPASSLARKQQPEEDLKNIQGWLETPSFNSFSWLPYLVSGLQIFSVVTLIGLLLGLPGKLVLASVVLNVVVTHKFRKKILELREKTSRHTRFLKPFANILAVLESQNFETSKLKSIKENIQAGGISASIELQQLSQLLFQIQSTENPYFYPIGNYIFVWDVFWALRLEKWKQRNASHLAYWFQGIYEIEALNSFAAAAYLNPDWKFPALSDEKFLLKGLAIAHPLLDRARRVENDMEISGIGKCIVVTGSNMSGKSTFLRTLGINAVMALSGLPVCARSFEISQLRLYTSMRTQDSLEENTSSFYAELKRLRGLLETLDEGVPVFYLLDEILKGTNSLDRHKGAKAIISQMNASNASGLISTHDLELGAVAQKDPEHVFNYSFNSYLESGVLRFDYKIRPGICNSFNASELMRQIGIKIKED